MPERFTPERIVTHSYRDPLSELWVSAAHKIGLQVQRTEDAFAHCDGHGNLYVATDAHLDADDCLAQMIFHELCHSLAEGPESFTKEDWGLDNSNQNDDTREHATLRIQATLAGRYGLREVLAPTTNFRAFYDALPQNPLLASSDDACQARLGVRRAQTNPWWPHLGKVLEATSAVVQITTQWPAPSETPSLYHLAQSPLPLHPTGLFGSAAAALCGTCAWRDETGLCLQSDNPVAVDLPGCERHEAAFDCQDCGACCRAAYHSVTITKGDVVAERHPKLLVHHESYSEIRREGDHCAALESDQGQYACQIYDDRPTCCREFENAGPNCITARRRLGLSL